VRTSVDVTLEISRNRSAQIPKVASPSDSGQEPDEAFASSA